LDCLTLHMKALWSFKMSGTQQQSITYWKTWILNIHII
jgi:hypothetical protein